MRYRVLGPITVEIAGRAVKLGGPRQRMVLAVLLSRANQVVSQDVVIDAAWAGNAPEAARSTLQSYVYGLRQVLGSEAIQRKGNGYVVEVDRATFDVLDFEGGVAQGHQRLDTDPSGARTALVDALGLWFGTPYGGLEDQPDLYGETQRLTELRLDAIETRIQADLSLGHDSALVGELETLVREYPLRERFWAQLLVALYRGGRQAEALRAFQQARTRLVEELGIEPGAELQRLEQRILNQDPFLLDSSAAAGRAVQPSDAEIATPHWNTHLDSQPLEAVAGRPLRGYELRQPIGEGAFGVVYRAYQPSVGREVAVKVIRPEYANDAAFVRRFEREAHTVAGLEHPHIVPLFDYWRDPGGAYLVMPVMRGGSLADALRSGGWHLEPTLRVLDQVGGALAHAHRRGVLHRGLNPGNILLDDEGNAYVSDFGIAIRTTDATAVTVTSSPGLVSPEDLAGEAHTVRSDVFSLGALAFHLLTGWPPGSTGQLLDLREARPHTTDELARVVERATATDPADRFGRVEDFLRELRQAAGADVVAASDLKPSLKEPVRNPYKGLRAFGEGDAIDFHGRSALVDELIERVRSHRLVAVVGPSGSGKSSLVRAGLIPALRAGGIPGSQEWLVSDMFPGSYPFEELEAGLLRVAVDRPDGLLADLLEPHGLLRVSKQILPGDDSTLLLVVDQFEELFSSVRFEETRRRFLDNLVAVAGDERSRVRIVLTMRADFLDRPLDYGEFAEALSPGLMPVGPPTRDGLAQAVAAPARAIGLELEPGLVGRIVADVTGQPGALPLLQYALTETFNRRDGGALTIAGYEATGGVTGALGRRAEELYEGLNGTAREAARQVFLRLVTVDATDSITRRRARQSELVSLAVDLGGVETVLNAFGGFRLLTFDRDPVSRGPTVEVAHEALMVEWPRLRGWIDDARQSLIIARRLAESTLDWIESGRDPSYLLRGSRLAQVEEWAAEAGVALAGDEAELIATSVEQRDNERAVLRRRRRLLVAALAIGLAIVSVLAVVAFLQRGVAERAALQARVRELAVTSRGHHRQNPELALLIAAEAFDESIATGGEPMPEAVSALAQAVNDWRLIGRHPAGEGGLAAQSSGSFLTMTAPGSRSNLQVLGDNGAVVSTLIGPSGDLFVQDPVFHPDGSRIAVAYVGLEDYNYQPAPEGVPDVVVFDTASGSEIAGFDFESIALNLAFSPSGEYLAVSSRTDVRVLDWSRGVEVARFEGSPWVGESHFLDEDRLLVAAPGNGFETYAIERAERHDQIPVPELGATTAVDESRTRVAYVAGNRLRVMDLATEEVVVDEEAAGVLTVALSADGSLLAYSGFDPVIYVLAVDTDSPPLELAGSLGNVHTLAFLDESRLASMAESDVLVWTVASGAAPQRTPIPLQAPQWGFQLSPDERFLSYFVSVSGGSRSLSPSDGFRLVEAGTGEEVLMREGEQTAVFVGIRLVSPDFTLVGSLRADGASTARRLPSWDVVRMFDPCRSPLSFTPDSRLVLLSGFVCDPTDPRFDAGIVAEVVDMESGRSVLTLPHRYIYSGEFNPDGAFPGGTFLAFTDQEDVKVWDVAAGVEVGRLNRSALNEQAILNLAFDPTGRYLVGGSTGGTVWVVDIEQVVSGADMVEALIFAPQAHTGAAPVPGINAGGVVGTAGFDGQVRLWDARTGRLIYEFPADMEIPVVRFTPDGSHLLYPHGLSIQRMPVDPYELRSLASQLLTRDFIPDECARYARPSRCTALAAASG